MLNPSDHEFIHLGLSARHRSSGPKLMAYRLRPFMNAAPAILSTPAFAHADHFLGFETAMGKDNIHIEAEYALLRAESAQGPAVFDSGYLQVGWLLTGESPVYDAKSGRLNRIRPKTPLGLEGFGAIELATRFDWTRLTDQQIGGGRQVAASFAINWYLSTHAKLAINYVDSSVKAGSFGDGRSLLLGLRIQIDW
ncbi:MAG: hypothetical protein CVV27_06355 [Candidatus Melainabacteria bacterium HGW-Melainabacteria-1]|nr:MAG: hypothetical protein CVV27_06355 [Candidatus Melainabacteria bacterium HGW-Melainabacteria-1]